MDELSLRTLARRLARRRVKRVDQDLEQEMWFAGWRVRDQSEAYIVRTMLNRLSSVLGGASLGSVRQNAGGTGKRHLHSLMSLEGITVPLDQRENLGALDFYPSELDWVWDAVTTERERVMLLDILEGNLGVRTRHGVKPVSAKKGEWPPFRQKLLAKWKEIHDS